MQQKRRHSQMSSSIPKKNQFSSHHSLAMALKSGPEKLVKTVQRNDDFMLFLFCWSWSVRATLHGLKSKSKLTVNHTEFRSVLSSIRWWWWRFSSHFSTNKKSIICLLLHENAFFPFYVCMFIFLFVCVCSN